ncbi:MAG: hypothetical protein LQ338_002106 [Usnochroma carphineum]|nr:MAG: hypothetical protein LQ338_002106 [Usnochroma carphineum]
MVQQGREVDGLISEWHRVFTLGGLVATLPWLINPLIHNAILKRYLMPSKRQAWASGHVMSVHGRKFEDRLRKPDLARPGNFFDSFVQTTDAKGEYIGLQAAEFECFVFTVGAQDTTAAFISAFVDHILRNPSTKTKLVKEINHFESEGSLSFPVVRYKETTGMPYFMACVRETLRLSPSVSMLLPRYVSPGGMYIGKTWVPDGTEISASPFVLHRDKQLFGDDAELFNPERWLGDVERVRLMQKYFFAFGYGSRKCIGRHLAMFEAQKFCMQLFRDFDVQYWSQNQPCRMENWGINVYFEQFVKLEPRAAITATSDGTRS